VNPNVLADRLLDEYVAAHARGERPDVRDFLERAGPARERLGELIDRYLELAPVQEPDEETIVALEARLQRVTALTAARTRRALKVDHVVDRLLAVLGLADALRPKLRHTYLELEGEQLDPSGVDGRVWDALREILGLDPRRLVPSPVHKLVSPSGLFFRRDEPVAAAAAFEPAPPATDEPDAVDLLFRRGLLG
jgi:hypothetical protein